MWKDKGRSEWRQMKDVHKLHFLLDAGGSSDENE